MIRAGVSKMTIPSLTVDELLTTINRTSLPTIIVEGSDDVAIYRWIEKQILRKNADVIQCGGRKKLIAVYERRHEIKKNISIVFLADKDMWIYKGVPTEYKSIIFTRGYSLENDLIEGSLNVVLKLLNEDELMNLKQIYNEIIPWYTREVCRYMEGNSFKLNYSIYQLLDIHKLELKDDFPCYSENNPSQIKIASFIKENKELHIRGKNLLDIFLFILQSEKRVVKYSKESLIDIIMRFSLNDNINLLKIIEKINDKFDGEKKLSTLEITGNK